MNKLFSLTSLILVSLAIAPTFNPAYADDDYIEARRLHESGEILPLETILERIRLTHPGKILEIELEKDDRQIVYEVEILGTDGVVREIYINAKTGQLIFSGKDD